jgi:ATP-dependent DNA helicase PIF1
MQATEPHVVHNDLNDHTFVQWLLNLGEKKLPSVEDEFVRCPASTLLNGKSLINAIYLGIGDVGIGTSREYMSECVILAPRNEEVLGLNSAILDRLPGDIVEYLSADQADDVEAAQTIPMEFLHSIEVSGFPSHKLCLKVGASIMLLRNLNPSKGLCNETWLIIKRLSARVIEVEILTSKATGNIDFLLRITFIFNKNDMHFPLHM